MKFVTGIFLVVVLCFSALLFSSVRVQLLLPRDWTLVEDTKCDFDPARKAVQQEKSGPQPEKLTKDKLVTDLFPTGLFDEKSCLSRYQSVLYRKESQRTASPYLISKLRSYEARHKKCGPYTKSYNQTVEDIKSGKTSANSECKYIVWIHSSGLGNRILTLTSTFIYALLTDRVLLVDGGVDIHDLFCEPFPGTSWLLPSDFPLISQFKRFQRLCPESYASLLRSNSTLGKLTTSAPPPFIYHHLNHDFGVHDKFFFCNEEQAFMQSVPLLLVRSNNYFLPSLFMIPSFEKELQNMFPDKEIVFHILGRYLFHPTNSVWGLITRYYQSYLSRADEIVGIQIRSFDRRPGPFKHVLDQILACIMEQGILPKVKEERDELKMINTSVKSNKTIGVLMTSLKLGYYDDISRLYWDHPTETGEVISFHQPSHEELQHSEKEDHNLKAWAEMYLLSLTDKLVTSAWSTFGYVAQGLGDLKPWILYKPENDIAPNPPCIRVMSIEPCFHAPPHFDCKTRKTADTGSLVPHVKHCEDVPKGVKLVNPNKEL